MVTHICNKFDYVIFRREEDYSIFINRLSVISENCNINILAFTIMSNHFHIITKGDNYQIFISKLKQVYTQCWNKRYQGNITLFNNINIRTLTTNKEILDAINYTLKNPLHHNVISNPILYKYSSINCYYTKDRNIITDEANTNNIVSNIHQLNYREKRKLFGNTISPNSKIKLINYTYASLESFIDFKSVEIYYSSYKKFIYEISKYNSDEIELFNKLKSRGDVEKTIDIRCNKVSDLDVCKIIDEYIKKVEKLDSFIYLTNPDKEYLRKILSNLGVQSNQLKRCWL